MLEYRQARPEEEADLLDFVNYVFSFSHRPHDFRKLLPKDYEHPGFHRHHLIASREGRIQATVATLPLSLRLSDDSRLSLGYVGTVSVHPRARGEGHMKRLMQLTRERALSEGMEMLVLAGQRQRYNYFGFEKAGALLSFEVNTDNLRHALSAEAGEDVRFTRLSGMAEHEIDQVYRLFERQVMRGERSREALPEFLRSWQAEAFGISKGGEVIGYLCAREKILSEWSLADEALLLPVLKAWLRYRGIGEATLNLPLHRQGELEVLARAAEDYSLFDSFMADVLDWRSVLEKLLRFKAGFVRLQDGERVVSIADRGRFHIGVKQGQPSVTLSEAEPDICLSPLEAVRYFFSFTSLVMPARSMPVNWLPLWFSVPESDAF